MGAPKLIVLCFDALEKDLIGIEYGNLRMAMNGKTDISEFKLPRSVILWSSFLTSRNMEIHLKDLLYEFEIGSVRIRIPTNIGDPIEKQIWGGWSGRLLGKLAPLRKYFKERIWRVRLRPEETFLRYFKSYIAIDMVAFTHKTRRHKMERELMGEYFNYNVEEGLIDRLRESLYNLYYGGKNRSHKTQDAIIKRSEVERSYKSLVWNGYRENKAELLEVLDKDYEIILFFTPLADLIGHLNFGTRNEMKKVYNELNSLAGYVAERVKNKDTTIIGISDHGMEQVVFRSGDDRLRLTRYGDHSDVKQGTYFINRTIDEIKERYDIIRDRILEDGEPMFNLDEKNDIENALQRLEDGNPTLRDFYHIIKIYGSINPPVTKRKKIKRR